jgi:hypothetical protein
MRFSQPSNSPGFSEVDASRSMKQSRFGECRSMGLRFNGFGSRVPALALAIAMLAFAFTAMAPSRAEACERWTFGATQEEEGRTLAASACAFDDRGRTFLELRCFGRQISVRYTPRTERDFNNQTLRFVFETDETSERLDMAYEGLDGAFAAYLRPSHPVFEALMAGQGLNIYVDRSNVVPERRFRLSGSRAAISRLLNGCRR